MSVLQQATHNVIGANVLPALAAVQQQWRSMSFYTSADKYHFKFGTNAERGTAHS